MKWTLPSRNDKRGLVKREIKWNFQNTYTCSTFPFTVSVFFAPPRFGSGSTERELQAICASDSVVKGTEISLKRTEAHIWTHCIKMDIIKLYLETTIQINKLKNKRTVSGPFRLPSWKQRDCKYEYCGLKRLARARQSLATRQLIRATRVFLEFQNVFCGETNCSQAIIY